MWPFKRKKVEEVKAEISEPITTLIRLIENDPERFAYSSFGMPGDWWSVVVCDGVTGEIFEYECRGGHSCHQWMTKSEGLAILDAAKKAEKIVNEIKRTAERARLVAIYCGEEQ